MQNSAVGGIVSGMKILTVLVSIFFLSAGAFALSFGDFVKNVKTAAEEATASSDSISALKTKQEATLAKYKQNKQTFLKGFADVAQSCGADALAAKAENALKTVEAQKGKVDAVEVAKVTDELLTDAKSSSVVSLPANAASSAKEACTGGLDNIGRAIQGEVEVAREISDLAKQVGDIMRNGTTAEKIQVSSTLSPTIELAKTIPQDISKSKDVVLSMVDSLKGKVSIPESLKSVLRL